MNPLPSRGFTWNIKSYFLWKNNEKYSWMSSAAVVIGILRFKNVYKCTILFTEPVIWYFLDNCNNKDQYRYPGYWKNDGSLKCKTAVVVTGNNKHYMSTYDIYYQLIKMHWYFMLGHGIELLWDHIQNKICSQLNVNGYTFRGSNSSIFFFPFL